MTKRAIINGKYYARVTDEQLSEAFRANRGGKYDKDRQREEQAVDILQPWLGNKPNPDFIKAYPRKAQQIFSKKELEEATS